LELARLTDTLVVDTDGVYDLADINDRLLLGLKGSMSEVLCRRRHNTSYADLAVMPTWCREPLWWKGSRHHEVGITVSC
jgi:hypothetical protein